MKDHCTGLTWPRKGIQASRPNASEYVLDILPTMLGACRFKPGVPFVGHRQAPDVTQQNAASHLGLFCLHNREISLKKN